LYVEILRLGLARAGGGQAVGARMIAARRRCLVEWLALRGGKPRARCRARHEAGMADVQIGTSGYVYRHWRGGVFYPVGLHARDELAWYASQFRTLELNNPFYRVPTAATFVRWRDETPTDFVFSVKVNRVISHVRRLGGVGEPLAAFLAVAQVLGPKLGPLLVQLPPHFLIDLPRFEAFLAGLPTSFRWVVEFRHPSWQTAAVYAALARHRVGLAVPVGGRLQPDLVTTADFSYIRMHSGRIGGAFAEDELAWWAGRIRGLARAGKDVWVYFNNDREGHAPRDASQLRELLRLPR
jgi:uncharacterized protein YecE (DUF72 family)